MSYEIKDEFRIFGIQNFELFEKLTQSIYTLGTVKSIRNSQSI